MSGRLARINRQTALRLLGTTLAILLLAYLLSRQGWTQILASIQQISTGRFLAAFGLIILSRLAVSARWHRLLASSPAQLAFRHTTRITFAGLFASNFLPTTVGGDVVRVAGALQHQGDRAVLAASVVVDRLVGVFAMATAIPFGVQSLWRWFQSGSASQSSLPHFAALSPLLLQERGKKLREYAQRVTRRLGSAIGLWLKRPQSLLQSVALSWVHMLCKFLAIQVLFGGMNQPLSLWLVAGLWSFTYFLTLFPLSINGLGLQEVSMAFIFANLGGVSLSSALTAALLIRTLEMGASLPGALFLPNILSDVGKERQPRL